MKSKRKYKKLEEILITLLLIAGGVLVSIPFLWMIFSSFKPANEVLAMPPTLLPENPTFENYQNLFTNMSFGIYLRNTLIIVLFSFIGLFFNGMAGYAFAKFNFKGKEPIFYTVLATMMIPAQVTMIPVYLILNQLGLTNTMAGIILPGLAAAFSIFLFRQFMSTIPTDLIEAARLDGAGEFRIFFRLIVPIAKPIFAVQAILTFIGAWNSFLWPLIIASDQRLYTLSVGLSLLQGQHASNFGLQMAGAAFMVVPIILIFAFFQKYIIEGFTMSGLK
ncbi:multiple sugar transport system permease protein [Evansella caseinilytica]|uniref:Multiple sugar transport system permease protein n=1 Tax=Evansella caseinilytica TaxID=1503961 RepID=A0A1H3GC50_9BACI|nr:carbohydrate ABC transporter permease [Evansella caseinilytica]SDY00856.1 multiple sugar transport system permease protein [Evansella caseinilytica]